MVYNIIEYKKVGDEKQYELLLYPSDGCLCKVDKKCQISLASNGLKDHLGVEYTKENVQSPVKIKNTNKTIELDFSDKC